MEALIRNARALSGVCEYDFTGNNGERYRYLDLFDADAGKVLRISLDKLCTPPAGLDFGTQVDLWCRIEQGDKIVRGEDRDRSVGQLKLKAVSIEAAKSATNGKPAEKPLTAAAA